MANTLINGTWHTHQNLMCILVQNQAHTIYMQYTVDLEMFVQRNFHMINFCVKNFRRNDPLPH